MNAPISGSYGSWRSPISASAVANAGRPPAEVQFSDKQIYWLEIRPHEGGRYVIMRLSPDGEISVITPSEFNVRSRVHEYGGGSYTVDRGTIFFVNFKDQRIYRQDLDQAPFPITPESEIEAGLRFADAQLTLDSRYLVCVHERHQANGEVINEIAMVPTDGSSPPQTIVRGHDFFSNPRLSPDGQQIAWLAWDHPQMPWDGTELWVSSLSIDQAQKIAGGEEESIFQPEWSPDGVLHFISDRTGWWNLYRLENGDVQPVAPIDADIGVPQWVFGLSRYAFLEDGGIICVFNNEGLENLGWIAPESNVVEPIQTDFTAITYLRSGAEDEVYFVGGSFRKVSTVARMRVRSGHIEKLQPQDEKTFDLGYLSQPTPIEFPTGGGLTAFALYYPPQNKDFTGPKDELPPLLVISHGGPTSAARTYRNLEIQYWTSRGIGVVDVNYGGSTGYGRAFRQRLNGQWGIIDTQDCIAAAKYLVEEGYVDGEKLAIRGGSAGGFTTLSALAFFDLFSVGASYYGVADLEALTIDTHKFESQYLERLVGPYPQAKDLYQSRSPLYSAERITAPLILFQGLEDQVVPPSQAEMMVEALEKNKVPFSYLVFEGEQHGFRRAETIIQSLEAELYFYAMIFGIDLYDPIEPVDIKHLN